MVNKENVLWFLVYYDICKELFCNTWFSEEIFKLASGRFRAGDITAAEYVELGMVIMGRNCFLRLLPDLLRTLPAGRHKEELSTAQRNVMAL